MIYDTRNEFYLTLVSNTFNPNEYNTLSTFSNFFANPICLKSQQWKFGLHSIFCHNQFKNDEDGDYLKVDCDLISPIENQDRCLCIFARPKKENHTTESIYFEPNVKEYFPTNTDRINHIGIKLSLPKANANLPQAILLSGQPTVIVLHFVRTNMFSPDFVIRINSSKEYNEMYQDNTSNHFRTILGRSFNFDPAEGDREVALSSITYKPEFSLSTTDQTSLYLYDADEPKKLLWDGKFPEYSGSSLNEYVIYLNDKVLSQFSNYDSSLMILANLKMDSEEATELIHISSNKPCIIELPYALYFNLGERNFIPITGISELEDFSYKIYVSNDKPYVFETSPDPNAFFPSMGFLYCDFITYNNIGDNSAPILKSFPLERTTKTQDFVTYSVKSLEYYPLSKFDLSTMEFSIRDVAGNLLPFKNKNANTMLTIMIRRQNKEIVYF